MFGYPVTVVRVRSGGYDRLGDPLPDQETPIEGGTLAPAGSTEDGQFRSSSIADWTFYAPTGTDVRSSDQFRLPAKYAGTSPGLFEVVGDPQVWGPNPFTGDDPGTVVDLKRRSG
ncbi:hypothetical protein [Brevibacterium sp.]|uniref:hypothetical protein n=1 Tax=Brevibacterium sp. TaxID=1701 RepID=UPI00281153E3|nr:hypothetical protein [Brevibacterium sp.]